MKEIYSIGENEPWRLTKDSAHRLLTAVCKTGAEIVAAHVDTTYPPTHVCIRVKLLKRELPEFVHHFKQQVEPVETVSGQ